MKDQCVHRHGIENWVRRADGSGYRCKVCSRERSRKHREKSQHAVRIVEQLGDRIDVDQLAEMLSR